MDFNRLTIKSQEAVAAAQELARRAGNPSLPRAPAVALLDQLPQQLVPTWPRFAPTRRSRRGRVVAARGSAVLAVLDAARGSARLEDDYVSTEHLLLALGAVPREQLLAKIKEVRGGQRVTSQIRRHLPGASRSSAVT